MEKLEITNNINRVKEKIEEIIKSVSLFSDAISENNNVISNTLQQINEKLEELFKSVKLFFETENAISSNLSENKNQLNIVIDNLQDIVKIVNDFIDISKKTTSTLEELDKRCENIVGLMDTLNELNERSMNTARNAEIKAYHSGEEGKGFEVVARFLGNFSSNSMEIVSSIVQSIKEIRKFSSYLKDSFSQLKKPVEEIGSITDTLRQSIDNLRDIFKSFDEVTYILKIEGEKESNTKSSLEDAAKNIKEASENLYLNSSRVNLVVRSKDSLYEVFKNVVNNFIETYEKNIYVQNSKEFLLNYLKSFLFIFNVIENEFKSINFEKIKKSIDVSNLENLKNSLSRLNYASEKIITSSNEIKKTGENLSSFLSKLKEQVSQLLKFVDEASLQSKNLQSEFSNFKRKEKSVQNITENLKDLSLYAKLESARSGKEDLNVIVEQMIELSEQFKKVSEKIEVFLGEIRNDVVSSGEYFNNLNLYLKELVDKFEASSLIISETNKSLMFIENYSEDFRKNLIYQNSLIEEITRSFESIISSFDTTIFDVKSIQEKIKVAKDETEDLKKHLSTIEISGGKGKDTLRLYLSSDPVTLDPSKMGDATSSRIGHLVFRGIFEFAYKTWVFPTLIESWKISDDGRKITFRLKNNIYAHNGSQITSEDVVFSYKRTMTAPNGFFFDAVENIRPVDRFGFEMELKYPYVPLFANLATIGGAIIPKDLKTPIEENPVGTGPFKFSTWNKGEEIELEAFDKYIFGRPYVDRIKFYISKDEEEKKTALDMFVAKLIDIASISYTQIDRIEKDEYLKRCLVREISLDFQYLGFNMLKKELPFYDVRVRRAMSYMIDRVDMLQKLDNGYGTPAKGPIPPGVDCYNPSLKGYDYNPERAKELLKEAGYPNGLPDKYILDTSISAANMKRAEYLINQFKKFGINLEIRTSPWKDFLKLVHGGEQQLYMLGWSSDNGDPDNFLYPLFHSKNRGDAGNTSFYSNPEVDKLIEMGMRELNPKIRREIYRKAEEMIVRDAPVIFLYHGLDLYLVRENVKGFVPNILENNKFELVYLE
uniref:Methyl-accepting transducer domain-containing protein n=1 Tax=candidate division WOR-3 bacterium TaxID=2052148 RepID=A0A7C4U7R2_UNCW3